LNPSKSNAWYKKWFNTQEYLDLYKHRDDKDASKIIHLLFKNIKLKKGSKVLDLACGNGRHSVLFAKKGYSVTGIDLSEYLIGMANKKRRTDYSKYRHLLNFETGDMRRIEHSDEFDLVVNLFTSFGYFSRGKENEMVISGIAKALKRGGYFLFDFLNRDFLINNLVPLDIRNEKDKVIFPVPQYHKRFCRKTYSNPKKR
jgi:SAM-dependent methyltransferase